MGTQVKTADHKDLSNNMQQTTSVYTLGAELAQLICKILIGVEPAQLFVSLVPSKLAASTQILLRACCQLHLRPSSACFV